MSGRNQDQRHSDFDPTACPILSRHWFGIEPPRLNSLVTVDAIADMRRRRHVRQLYRLGPRAVDELLVEIGAERGITTIIERKIERYAGIDPEATPSTAS
jgi:hypothetical protein